MAKLQLLSYAAEKERWDEPPVAAGCPRTN